MMVAPHDGGDDSGDGNCCAMALRSALRRTATCLRATASKLLCAAAESRHHGGNMLVAPVCYAHYYYQSSHGIITLKQHNNAMYIHYILST